MFVWLTPLILAGALGLFALGYALLQRRYPLQTDPLVDAVDQLLPQTQCAQCGYPGCRPYAEAVVQKKAALNLCPPGGKAVHSALVELIGTTHDENSMPPTEITQDFVAVIDESQCIGCTLCLPPCPVDAIVGSTNKMHTVIAAECTGCELCIPACPVDCISLTPRAAEPFTLRRRSAKAIATKQVERGCINCGQCNPVCPIDLPAQELLHAVQRGQDTIADQLGLTDCIECGLCDRACPSDISMAQLFGNARSTLMTQKAQEAAKTRYKTRFAAHQKRLQAAAEAEAERRAKSLQNAGRWS